MKSRDLHPGLKALVFFSIAAFFAAEGSANTPFWDLSAGILAIVAIAYVVSPILPKEQRQAERIPIKIPVRKD
ncbi:hypothetical protein AB4090_08415 [Acidithiobacillus sp. IBUN Pt1247-S3]|uniref:hypothetical protein n=1 Tax=Acidithiobacillus sp. IBUN Pt1247-S3 TaxID=3166642 RepID=UPI0034E4FCFF